MSLDLKGYSHPGYAASLGQFGKPRSLAHSGGWLLQRPIRGTPHYDAMGCYPLFACHDWSKLELDLNQLGDELISVALVADPFGNHDQQLLKKCFPDVVIPFKQHLVTDLSQSPDSFVNAQHRRKARRALGRLIIERCVDATLFVDEWNKLYANLIQRHGIRGLSAFSRAAFSEQLAVPGIVMFRALAGNETVGMNLWYVDRGVAYYHLGAYSDVGYELEASFALFWHVLDYFGSHDLKWLDLGAGVGLSHNREANGLTRFKCGWANGTRTAYFCGRIFDRVIYEEIMNTKQIADSDYFPAYRKGEFG